MTEEAPAPATLKLTDGSATGNLIGSLTTALDQLENAHRSATLAARQANDAYHKAVRLGAAHPIEALHRTRDQIEHTQSRLQATLTAARQALHTAQGLLDDAPATDEPDREPPDREAPE